MGSYLEAIELGADTIVTSGGHGPCRAGFYAEVHRRILESLGHQVKVIVFDAPGRGWRKFLHNVRLLKGRKSWFSVYRALRLVYRMVHELDRLEKRVAVLRAHEAVAGSASQAWNSIQKRFDQAQNEAEVDRAVAESNRLLEKVRVHSEVEKPLRIGIVGEIYVVMESSINFDLEETLGKMGVEVERSQYLSEWVEFNLFPRWLKRAHEEEILQKGEPYIPLVIGGHAKQTVGHIVDYHDRGFDGVIHLMPFACLPELVTQSIIPHLSQTLDIPVLSLSIDEQTGLANTLTRIEAFVDLLRNKRQQQRPHLDKEAAS
jgi:predicted nucleotide-binding protein (sugar kinase/HSP70/actin superfamily)